MRTSSSTPSSSSAHVHRRIRPTAAVAIGLLASLAVLGLPGAAGAAGTRYLDPIFPTVTKTTDVVYGSAVNDRGLLQDLRLDLFRPDGDVVTDRPAIVFIHGGGFVSGTKDNAAMVDLANEFAKRGYVTASIDYRLSTEGVDGFDPTDPRVARAHRNAQHDAQAAVRFLRANAATYGVDPRHVAVAGGSAGAATSMFVGYDNEDVGDSGSPGESSRVCAAMSLSGAVGAELVDPTDLTDAIWYQGTADKTVPWLLAQRSSDAVAAAGMTSEMHLFDGAGHVDYRVFKPSILTDGVRFFYDHVATTSRDCRVGPPAPPGGFGSFQPAGPHRIVDTRDGTGGPAAPLGPGETRALSVDGWPGLPPNGVKAVAVNVTAVSPSADTHLTLWPHGAAMPTTSTTNPAAGETVATMAVVPIGADGKVDVYNNSGSTHLLVDFLGWFGTPAGTTFVPVTPTRLLDTRNGTGGPAIPLGPGETRLVQAAGLAGIPTAGVGSVALNVTAVDPTEASHLTVWTALGAQPGSSNLNVAPGRTVANQVLVSVFPTGFAAIRNNSGTTHVVVDVTGYYATPAGARFDATTPTRLLDTRDGTGAPVGRIGPGGTVDLAVAGVGPVPSDAAAVDVTVTAVVPSATSHVTVWPGGTPQPLVSTLNTTAGRTVANHATIPVGPDGSISLYNNSGDTDLLVDVDGWFT